MPLSWLLSGSISTNGKLSQIGVSTSFGSLVILSTTNQTKIARAIQSQSLAARHVAADGLA